MTYIVRKSSDPMGSRGPVLPMSKHDQKYNHRVAIEARRKWLAALNDPQPREPWWARLVRAFRRIVW